MSALYTLVKKMSIRIFNLFSLLASKYFCCQKRDDPKSIWIPIVISFLYSYQIIPLFHRILLYHIHIKFHT